MLSAVIRNGHSYRAVPLAGQLVHHRSAHPGPLVLGATPRNSPAPTLDRDRTVSQRSEPSSRTALMGEQPNPWEVLPPQDATSRHRAISAVTGGADYLSTLLTRMSEGPAFDGDHRFASAEADLPSHHSQCESGSVVTGSCRFVVDRLPTVLSSFEDNTVGSLSTTNR